MAKKSIKEAAAASTSVFDQIARGNITDTQNTQDTQDTETALYTQDAKSTLDVNKEGVPLARLNLKIPAELKEYLTVAAARASIKQRRNISLTQYLCDLITADKAKNE